MPFPSPGDLPNPVIESGSRHCRQTLYRLSHQGSQTMVEVMKIMATSFKTSHACNATLSAPNPAAGHQHSTPLPALKSEKAQEKQIKWFRKQGSPLMYESKVTSQRLSHAWEGWAYLRVLLPFWFGCSRRGDGAALRLFLICFCVGFNRLEEEN